MSNVNFNFRNLLGDSSGNSSPNNSSSGSKSSNSTNFGTPSSGSTNKSYTNPLSNNAQESLRKTGSDLDKDAFLKLLLTQLQNQDPLEPMENTEFIAQMAQFTSLEQMQNLNSTMSNSQAYSLIGKPVYATLYNESKGINEDVVGVVSKVTVKNGSPYLIIGEKEVPYANVQQVLSNNQMDNIESGIINSQTMSLIGKNIQAILLDSEGNATGYVEGKVDFVKFINGTPVLSVDGKEVFAYEVLSVSEKGLLIGKEVQADLGDGNVITGKIDGVKIKDKKLYVTIGDKEAEITDINSMITAISLVGKTVNSEKVSGVVDGVIIKAKVPYLIVDGKEVEIGDIY